MLKEKRERSRVMAQEGVLDKLTGVENSGCGGVVDNTPSCVLNFYVAL